MERRMTMLRNGEGYTDPTADRVFSSVLKKPPLSEQDAKSLPRIKHLMHLLRFAAIEFGFDIEERVILRDKQTGKIWR